jgi:DNA polymerase III epsilon subunit family exonuclease
MIIFLLICAALTCAIVAVCRFSKKQEPFVPYAEQELARLRPRTKLPAKLPHTYIVFDIETTGLSRTQDRIIEIAATRYEEGSAVDTFHAYVNPGRHVPNFITRLTGIRNSDVAESPDIMAVKPDFLRFVGTTPLVGHNINTFDIPFLEAQMGHIFPNQLIDTLPLAKHAFPGLPNYKLVTLNHVLGLGGEQAHRAGADVSVNNALLHACYSPKRYAKRISDPSILDTIPADSRNLNYRPDIHIFSPFDPAKVPSTSLSGKGIVFSGEFNLLREEVCQIAVDAGAILKSSISRKVDYFVLGYVDPKHRGEDGLGSKERAAHQLIASGNGNLQIIDEQTFLRLAAEITAE